jgi:signal peptidase I
MNVFGKMGNVFLDGFETIVLSLAIFVVIYFFIASPHQVKGLSMYPTFNDQELILTDKVSYRLHEPKRGDVIVFKAPTNPDYDYIKRIIGVAGDKVMVEDNKVYVNGVIDSEEYLPPGTGTTGGAYLPEGKEITVPPDNLFVMGDNRPGSSDSRAWGLVTKEAIIGKVFLRYFPFNKFGLLGSI